MEDRLWRDVLLGRVVRIELDGIDLGYVVGGRPDRRPHALFVEQVSLTVVEVDDAVRGHGPIGVDCVEVGSVEPAAAEEDGAAGPSVRAQAMGEVHRAERCGRGRRRPAP